MPLRLFSHADLARRARALPALLISVIVSTAAAQAPATGAEMYRVWCQQCHGADGSGRFDGRPVRTVPLDFSDCRVATPEPDADWALAIRAGGQAVGLSADMPSFETLTSDQIRLLVAHLRSFCREPGWPHGNLNVPRALFARKAFPENEVVIRPSVSHGLQRSTMSSIHVELERRLGRRAQIEIEVPFHTVGQLARRVAGIGDISVGAKYVLLASHVLPVLVTGGGSLSFPTGDRLYTFGEGTRVFEPYLAAGTLAGRIYVQGDIGAQVHLPRIDTEPLRRLTYNAAITFDLSDSPTTWSIGLEVNGRSGGIGLIPTIRKGLTRSGSLSAAAGFRIPVRPPFPYSYDVFRWTGYLLWEPVPRSSRR